MAERWTLGKFVLVMLLLIVSFNTVLYLISYFVSMIDIGVRSSENLSSWWVFDPLLSFYSDAYGWLKFIFTNALAVAALIFISVLYEALETRWR